MDVKERGMARSFARSQVVTWACVVGLVLYAVIASVDRAARRPFWFDEVLTIAVSAQSSTQAIRHAIEAGADSNPPLFHLIERAAGRVPINRHVAYRLPSITAFALTLVAIFTLVRRGEGVMPALVATLAIFATQLFTVYAVEARPYAMVTCAVAWALVAWQRIEDDRRFTVFLAALLSLATSLHLLAILQIVPFAVAELARSLRVRQVRMAVWAALVVPLVPVALSWPLISATRAQFAAHFWARPSVGGMMPALDQFLNTTNWWGLAVALAVAGVGLWDVVRVWPRDASQSRSSRSDYQVALFALIMLTPTAYVLASVVHAPLTARYVLPTILGIAGGVGIVLGHSRRARVLALACLAGVVALRQLEQLRFRAPMAERAAAMSASAITETVRKSGQQNLPVAIANPLAYLPLAFYGFVDHPPVFYVIDPDAAARLTGTDTPDLLLERVAPLLAANVERIDQFIALHQRFLVYAVNDRWEWLPRALVERGFTVERIATAPDDRDLLLAERRSSSNAK
jgi:hypothetical protein